MITCDESIILSECEESSEEEAVEIIKALEKELAASPTLGVGLAASQIGILKKVFIIRTGTANGTLNFVNSKFISLSQPLIVKEEGCLSYPDKSIKTLRYNKVTITDLYRPNGVVLSGIEAVVAQHEHQHTVGQNMFRNELSKIKDSSICLCGSEKTFSKCCKPYLLKNMRIL